MKTEHRIQEQLFIVEAKTIEGVLRRAVRHALLIHKRAGNHVATWKENQVVSLPPEQIPVEDVPETEQN